MEREGEDRIDDYEEGEMNVVLRREIRGLDEEILTWLWAPALVILIIDKIFNSSTNMPLIIGLFWLLFGVMTRDYLGAICCGNIEEWVAVIGFLWLVGWVILVRFVAKVIDIQVLRGILVFQLCLIIIESQRMMVWERYFYLSKKYTGLIDLLMEWFLVLGFDALLIGVIIDDDWTAARREYWREYRSGIGSGRFIRMEMTSAIILLFAFMIHYYCFELCVWHLFVWVFFFGLAYGDAYFHTILVTFLVIFYSHISYCSYLHQLKQHCPSPCQQCRLVLIKAEMVTFVFLAYFFIQKLTY